MNREDTADSSTLYDSHDDNEDYFYELEDDSADGNPVEGYNDNGSTKANIVNDTPNTSACQASRPKVDPKKKKGTKKKRPSVVANLAATKFSIVRKVCSEIGMKVVSSDSPDCMLVWSDAPVTVDKIVDLKLFQKINHFPGMCEISRKDTLARNMAKMHKECPEEFNFVPQTWNFPGEYTAFQSYLRDSKKKKKQKTFIIKPANGAMGNGIKLTRTADRLMPHSYENVIVQEYIEKPLLMDNFKFDLRIYVLVTSCDPLKIFIFNDGLVRMGTVEYAAPTDANITCHFMHLTNYSVNKYNDAFVKTSDEDPGSKRTLKYLFEWLSAQGQNPDLVWTSIQDVVVKTLLVAEPHVYRAYHVCRPSDPGASESVCFEILGFDIMLDKKLKPWVLEVNRAPSFGTDQALDYVIKRTMLRDAFKLINIRISDKRKGIAQEKKEARKRLLKPVKRMDDFQTDEDRRKQIIQQRKNELKTRLAVLRRDAAKEEYENRHMGNFIRIYPTSDKFRATKYRKLAEAAARVFTGRPYLQKETARHYHSLKEEEVLELLEQAEDGSDYSLLNEPDELALKPPKPLSSMPTAKPVTKNEYASDDISKLKIRPYSSSNNRVRPEPTGSLGKRKGLSKSMSSLVIESKKQEDLLSSCLCGDVNELTMQSLDALNDMRIKFPGKSTSEAADLLDSITENWKYHKPRVASYWLVKLDSAKRRKVIDIVKGNVRAILQRVWKLPDIDSLRLYRIFNKIFNRLLASHGQGLWNCFSSNGDSWESFISKSTENVTQVVI